MAPLPTNSTGVLFIDYTSGGQRHSAHVRLPLGANTTEAIAAYNALKGTIAPFLYTSDSITGARWRAPGSKLSFPIAVSPQAGSASGTPDPERKPQFLSLTGRGGSGRRARFTLFTSVYDMDVVGYRETGFQGSVGALQAALAGSSVQAVDIDNKTIIWNNYTNRGVNAYYQRKQRRTG